MTKKPFDVLDEYWRILAEDHGNTKTEENEKLQWPENGPDAEGTRVAPVTAEKLPS